MEDIIVLLLMNYLLIYKYIFAMKFNLKKNQPNKYSMQSQILYPMEFAKHLTLIIPEDSGTVKELSRDDVENPMVNTKPCLQKKRKQVGKLSKKRMNSMKINYLDGRKHNYIQNRTYMYIDMNNIYINYIPNDVYRINNNDNKKNKNKDLELLNLERDKLKTHEHKINNDVETSNDLNQLFYGNGPDDLGSNTTTNNNINNIKNNSENKSVLLSIVNAIKNSYNSLNLKENLDSSVNQVQNLFKNEKKTKQENVLLKNILRSLLSMLENVGIKNSVNLENARNNNKSRISTTTTTTIAATTNNKNNNNKTNNNMHDYNKDLYEVFTKSTYDIDSFNLTTKPAMNATTHQYKLIDICPSKNLSFEDAYLFNNPKLKFHWINYCDSNNNNLKRNIRKVAERDTGNKYLNLDSKKRRLTEEMNKKIFKPIAQMQNSITTTECITKTTECTTTKTTECTTTKTTQCTTTKTTQCPTTKTTQCPTTTTYTTAMTRFNKQHSSTTSGSDQKIIDESPICSGRAKCPVCSNEFVYKFKLNKKPQRSFLQKKIIIF